MSLSMKFFRWLLSHLTLIIVLSLILYIYWNRNEFWPETTPVAGNEISAIETQPVAVSSSPDTGSRNKSENQSTNGKTIAKHAIIKNEEPKTRLYPDDINNIDEAQKNSISNTEADNDIIAQNPNQGHSDNQETDQSPMPAGFAERKRIYEQKLSLTESVAEKNADEAAESELSQLSELKTVSVSVSEAEQSNANAVSFQDKDLQKQIRARQKKLSNQMVSLINVTMKQSQAAVAQPVIDIEPIEPVIETPEQQQLLRQARQAFDEGNFELAEEKYLQLMNELPELPDVVGELANVYKTQKRQSDYIAMNTDFVKRLVEHYRFEEAWKVMTETAKTDKEIANKQRRIINKKQQELKL